MRYLYLFEDDKDSPSSVLLKACEKGKDIYFTGGNAYLAQHAIRLAKLENVFVYVFMDLPPNRDDIIRDYHDLRYDLKVEHKLDNVEIIPIVCIEYYICRYLMKYEYNIRYVGAQAINLYEYIVKTFCYSKVDFSLTTSKTTREYIESSLEHAYKYILSKAHMMCVRNKYDYIDKTKTIKKGNSPKGMFYDRDCNCNYIGCISKSRDSLKVKAEKLYSMLPVFSYDIESDYKSRLERLGIQIEEITLDDIKSKVKLLYNNMCDSMGISKIDLFEDY